MAETFRQPARIRRSELDIDNDALQDVHPERLESILDRRQLWLSRGVRSWWVRYLVGTLMSLAIGVGALTRGLEMMLLAFAFLMVAFGFLAKWYFAWTDEFRALSRGSLHWCRIISRSDSLMDGTCEHPRGSRQLSWAHYSPMHDGSGHVAVLTVGDAWLLPSMKRLRRLGVPENELESLTAGLDSADVPA